MWQRRGRLAALRTSVLVLASLGGMLLSALAVAGPAYRTGLDFTTLARQSGSYSAVGLLLISGKWLWAVALLAALGVLAAATAGRGRVFAMVAAAMAVAVLLAPVEQARIHTITSMFKHDDYGAWFASVIAGYALAALSRVVPQDKALAAFRVGIAGVATVAVLAMPTAVSEYRWPNASALIPAIRQIIGAHPGPILAGDNDNTLLHYYLGSEVGTLQVVSTFYISYQDPATGQYEHGLRGYAAAIDHRYFAVVILQYSGGIDGQLKEDMLGRYRELKPISYAARFPGQFTIWVRTSP
jgi:hypothetical protein